MPVVVVQNAAGDAGAPEPAFIEACVRHALPGVGGEIVIRIVDQGESAALNRRYRGKNGPTNVLAFPPGEISDPDDDSPLAGDATAGIAVIREAHEQGKAAKAHWAHIVIHACLHLTGYDHTNPAEAEQMEARERSLLAELGIADPYEVEA